MLNVPGEAKYQGRGVSYCALCDGTFFKDKQVMVVGGGNSAAASARYLANIAAHVKLVHRRDMLRAEKAYEDTLKEMNVEFLFNTRVLEIKGDGVVQQVVIENCQTRETKDINVDGVFVQVGEIPNSEIARIIGMELDEYGYIIVDTDQTTNIQGIFAAGDVTDRPVKQIGTAIGEGIIASTEAFCYIKRPYYRT
jgi:thioredoxin reductase (NADPH)